MEIIKREVLDTLSIRITTAAKDLPARLGEIYGEVTSHFGKDGIVCTGAPFAMYHNMDMDNLDVEAGFPVSGAAKDYGRVRRSSLPGGELATELHVGSYDTLEKTYEKLMQSMKAEGLETEEYMYEEYLNDPSEVPTDKLETRIYFILKR